MHYRQYLFDPEDDSYDSQRLLISRPCSDFCSGFGLEDKSIGLWYIQSGVSGFPYGLLQFNTSNYLAGVTYLSVCSAQITDANVSWSHIIWSRILRKLWLKLSSHLIAELDTFCAATLDMVKACNQADTAAVLWSPDDVSVYLAAFASAFQDARGYAQ